MADQDNKPQDPATEEQKAGDAEPKIATEGASEAASAKPPEEKPAEAAKPKAEEKPAEAPKTVTEAKPEEKPSETAAAKPAEEKPAADKPAAEKPAAEKPAAEKPAPKPAAAKPPAAAGDKPAPAKPAAAEGAAKKPAARAPATMPTVEIKDDPLIDAIKEKFGSSILEAVSINGQQVIRVAKDKAHDLLAYLRWEASPGFDLLADLTAVHAPDKEDPFDIVYQTYSVQQRRRLRVKTGIKDGEQIGTAADIWSTANWMEREVYDLFGVKFTNHPDLRRILLPQGWSGHPFRKDHPLEYRDNEWVSQNLKIRDLPEDWDYSGKFE